MRRMFGRKDRTDSSRTPSPDPTPRRLVLHMGLTKTGSTAIQTWCVWNRDFLLAHGVRYPEHGSDESAFRGAPLPGNGTPFLPFLGAPPRMDRAAAKRGVEAVIGDFLDGGAPTTLASNEKMWGQLRAERFEDLVRRISAMGVQVQVVVYLRDVASHAVSLYAQVVQQGALTTTLEEFLAEQESEFHYRPRLRENLETMLAVLGRDNMMVRHYDSVRGALIEDFLSGVLTIEDRDGVQQPPNQVSNRSLGLREIEWKRHVNALLGEDRVRSKELGRRVTMLSGMADDQRLAITARGLGRLEQAHSEDVAWVNRVFFGGEPVLSIDGGCPRVDRPQQPLVLDDHERHLLDWVASMAATAK